MLQEQSTKEFDYAFILYSVYYAIKMSQLDYLPSASVFRSLALYLALAFALLSILKYFKWSLLNTLISVPLVILSIYEKIALNNNAIIVVLLMMAAYNISFPHITKKCIQGSILAFSIVLFAVALGLIDDRMYFRDVDGFKTGMAHDLGFKYYSFYSYLGMGIVQCLLYRWYGKLNISRILIVLGISYLIYFYSSTRLQLLTCLSFILLAMVLPRFSERLFRSKVTLFLSIVLYPLICIFLFFVSKYALLRFLLDDFDSVNKLFSGRLGLNEEAFMRYEENLLGNRIEFDTSARTTDYFYIDSGYIYVILNQGIIFTAILLLIYAILSSKLYKSGHRFLFAWLFIYAFVNIVNGFLFDAMINPIILLTFTSIGFINSNTQSTNTYSDEEEFINRSY